MAQLLKDLTFSDLISLRDHFDYLAPSEGKELHSLTEKEKFCIEERDYLDRYIAAKYNKVKSDSIVKKV